jgi:hypothetical protein
MFHREDAKIAKEIDEPAHNPFYSDSRLGERRD